VTQAELQQQLDFAQKVDGLVSLSYNFHEQAAKFQHEVPIGKRFCRSIRRRYPRCKR